MNNVKAVAAVLVVVVILNFLLFIFGFINPLLFWIVTAVIAFAAYAIIPFFLKIKKKR